MESGSGRLRIAIAGSGNVASHLACAFAAAPDCDLVAIASRCRENAEALARRCGETVQACGYSSIADCGADVIVVSVADRAAADVVRQIGNIGDSVLVLHTSGTLDKSCLEPISPRTGILYPFQSFTKGFDVDMAEVPVFIETAFAEDYALARHLAMSISRHVYDSDEQRRRHLHIAGEFTNNFVNAILGVVDEELAAAGYPAEVAEPLLRLTIAKAGAIGSFAAQTGPAVRGDMEVMRSQCNTVAPEYREVYRAISNLIMKKHNIADEQDKL